MIGLIAGNVRHPAAPLVLAALRRSVSRTAARRKTTATSPQCTANILVAIEPDEAQAKDLLASLERGGCKLMLFGRLPDLLRRHLGLRASNWPDEPERWSRSPQAPLHGNARSAAEICYTPTAAPFSASRWQRPLERFDFTDEWNNLGYGAVRADGGIWALAMPVLAPARNTLAEVRIADRNVAAYAALFDLDDATILWFNRPTGPIDSFEWHLVEQFLSNWRHGELPCQPVLQEIPWGYDAAVTMRLDCDEDVDSARALRAAYRGMKVPFSLAVHTANLTDTRHHALLKEMSQDGEAVLSHTATHAANWGGDYESALREARDSASQIQTVTGEPPRYAVAPFHQAPPYALDALADAGYDGCIGGIVRNDPEFLLARGGKLAGVPADFVGHSQQCMLHGDCMLESDDPISIFKSAFAQAKETRTLFGYLDHPFSARYQYGWSDEAARIEAHKNFIAHIRRVSARPCFMSEDDAMDFLRAKSAVEVLESDDGEFSLSHPNQSVAAATVEYCNQNWPALNQAFS
jgi:hypothetical protein